MSESIIINQFNTSCLSQYSYYIESQKESLIIDPVNDFKPYTNVINENKSSLKYILNTHTHSDYLSGSVDLASHTGAILVYGPNSFININGILVNEDSIDDVRKDLLDYNIHIKFMKNNEIISIGKIKIQLIYSPGHTLDSSCFLIVDGNGEQNCFFTGDTILIGDVGYPDQAILSSRKDKVFIKEMSIKLYKSIQNIKSIVSEDIIIYPLHSSIGLNSDAVSEKSIQKSTTMKEEKINNKFIKSITEDEFLNLILNKSQSNSDYFKNISNINLNYLSGWTYDYCLKRQFNSLSIKEFLKVVIEDNVTILDTRNPLNDMNDGYIQESYLISIKAVYSQWAGYFLNLNTPIIVISKENKQKEVITRLLKIGFRNIYGYLSDSFRNFTSTYDKVLKETGHEEHINRFKPIKLNVINSGNSINYIYNNYLIVDVREEEETIEASISNTIKAPLSKFNNKLIESVLDKNKDYYFLCKNGIRSAMGISLLINKGFSHSRLYILEGGMTNLKEKSIRII